MPSQKMHNGVWGWKHFLPWSCWSQAEQLFHGLNFSWLGTTCIRDVVCGAAKWPGQQLTQKSTSHSPVGSSVSLHGLLLWAVVPSCQNNPRAGYTPSSHVMSFTNLLIHLANSYWTPPKSQALGIHTWIEYTWPLPSSKAFFKSLGRCLLEF